MENIQELIDKIPSSLQSGNGNDINAVIKLNITGENGKDWFIEIKDNKTAIRTESVQDPTLTLICDSRDFMSIANGQMDAGRAFMAGKLQIKGDISVALKLMSILKPAG